VDADWFEPQLERYGLHGRCELRGFLGRSESISVMSQASLFYLGLSQEEKGVIPGRLFTLLSSGRPILAAVPPDSEVAKLIRRTRSGFCFTEDNLPEAADYLRTLLERHRSGTLDIKPLPDYAREFASDRMAEKFARILDRICQ
jgi:hypothetical protein